MNVFSEENWSRWSGLNRRPTVYETVALPAELHRPPKTTRALCHARQTWQAIHQTDEICRSSGARWVISITRRRGTAGRRLGLISDRPPGGRLQNDFEGQRNDFLVRGNHFRERRNHLGVRRNRFLVRQNHFLVRRNHFVGRQNGFVMGQNGLLKPQNPCEMGIFRPEVLNCHIQQRRLPPEHSVWRLIRFGLSLKGLPA